MAKFTKGIWRIDYTNEDGDYVINAVEGEDLCTVAIVTGVDRLLSGKYPDGIPEGEFNAKLIAAAPVMYEALKELQNHDTMYDFSVKHLAMILDAIAQTEGT